MPPRPVLAALALGVVLGVAAGAGAGWLGWGRQAATLRARVDALEASAAQVQGERDRLHRELGSLVRERREMADTAEHLRQQVEEQLRRLESLAQELAQPEGGDEPPAPAP
jgi:septal ring factor EnvC (AmiA/AmiB activator)